jgi:hypothetical protein
MVTAVFTEAITLALLEMAKELDERDDHAPFPLVRRTERVDMGDHYLTRKADSWSVTRKTKP